jgi:ABC-type transport system involved in multi-copper enzyme maturation permease subunit
MRRLLYAELTKFWTVRGWVIGMLVAILVTLALPLLAHPGCSNTLCPATLGPGGESVTDTFYFVRHPLTGNATITVRVTSLTAPEPWSKAGIIIKASTAQGSAYAAMMVTGSHGVRMQWDFVNDTPGLAGPVSEASPRWLRLTRAGDTITGYDSADGVHWAKAGTAVLSGLPVTAQAGLFAASPKHSQVTAPGQGSSAIFGAPTQATAVLDHVQGLTGTRSGGQVGGGPASMSPTARGGFRQAGSRFTVTGSGDIAPDPPAASGGYNIGKTLGGTFAGLIAVIVVATMFITAEYRRGLIRVTLTASPRRGNALAAKAIVIGAVAFVTGTVAAAIALTLGEWQVGSHGIFIDPVSTLATVRLTAGTGALCAAAAVLAVAIGTIVRRSAAAVTMAIVVIVFPYVLSTSLTSGFTEWLLRIAPGAGFAIQQPYPQYPQISASYTITNGYLPLSPWAGFAVLCAWAAAALALAGYLLRRRDA